MMRLACVLLLLLGCNGKTHPDPDPDASITVAGKTYRLEFVTTRAGRKALADRTTEDHALLVLHARPRFHHDETAGRFDVLFLDDDGRVLEVQKLERQRGGITSTVECERALFLPPGSGARAGEALAIAPWKIAGEELAVVRIGDRKVYVEKAETPDERQHGLMWRPRMSSDDGMLFVYPEPDMKSFWMGNTLIDLDIAFFREDRSLINVVEMRRYADPSTDPGDRARSAEPAMYVLELNYGWFRARGITDEDGRPRKPLAFGLEE